MHAHTYEIVIYIYIARAGGICHAMFLLALKLFFASCHAAWPFVLLTDADAWIPHQSHICRPELLYYISSPFNSSLRRAPFFPVFFSVRFLSRTRTLRASNFKTQRNILICSLLTLLEPVFIIIIIIIISNTRTFCIQYRYPYPTPPTRSLPSPVGKTKNFIPVPYWNTDIDMMDGWVDLLILIRDKILKLL